MANIHLDDELAKKIDIIVKETKLTPFTTRTAFIEHNLNKIVDALEKRQHFNYYDIEISDPIIKPDFRMQYSPCLSIEYIVKNNTLFNIIVDRFTFEISMHLGSYGPGLGYGYIIERNIIKPGEEKNFIGYFDLKEITIDTINKYVNKDFDKNIEWEILTHIHFDVEGVGFFRHNLGTKRYQTLNQFWRGYQKDWDRVKRDIKYHSTNI